MDNKKTLRVAFYVGDLPTTTFINRLAAGLTKNDVEVTMFGLIKKRFKPAKGVRISGARDGFKEGRINRYVRYLRYSLLLRLSRPKQKRILDHWISTESNGHWNKKALLYPMLWLAPDIIHLQWVKAINHFGWCHLVGIKLVVSLRGAHINYSPFTVPGLADVYRKNFPLVDGFHGVSQAICKEAQQYGLTLSKSRVVYSGFDLAQFPKSGWHNKSAKPKSSTLNVVSVGRSHWKKGYNFALDAMGILKQQNIHVKYSIIGAQGHEEILFQRHQLQLEDEVDLLGQIPFERVKETIKQADVLLLPSVEEGIANVVLEAMLMGTMVVTTNCGGMVESVEHGVEGFVVPVRNPEAISQAIMQVINMSDEEKEDMINAAYIKVSSQHNEGKMVEDMKQLYLQTI